MMDTLENILRLFNSYPIWAKLVVFVGLSVSLTTLIFAPRTPAQKTHKSSDVKSDKTQEPMDSMIANVLKGYQDDTVYRQWKEQYRNQLFSGLDVLPPNQAIGLLANRIDTLVVDFNAEIAEMDRHLQSPPSEDDGNGLPRLIDAYARKNKVRIKSALLDARQMIRDQSTSGIESRELLIQIKSVLQ